MRIFLAILLSFAVMPLTCSCTSQAKLRQQLGKPSPMVSPIPFDESLRRLAVMYRGAPVAVMLEKVSYSGFPGTPPSLEAAVEQVFAKLGPGGIELLPLEMFFNARDLNGVAVTPVVTPQGATVWVDTWPDVLLLSTNDTVEQALERSKLYRFQTSFANEFQASPQDVRFARWRFHAAFEQAVVDETRSLELAAIFSVNGNYTDLRGDLGDTRTADRVSVTITSRRPRGSIDEPSITVGAEVVRLGKEGSFGVVIAGSGGGFKQKLTVAHGLTEVVQAVVAEAVFRVMVDVSGVEKELCMDATRPLPFDTPRPKAPLSAQAQPSLGSVPSSAEHPEAAEVWHEGPGVVEVTTVAIEPPAHIAELKASPETPPQDSPTSHNEARQESPPQDPPDVSGDAPGSTSDATKPKAP